MTPLASAPSRISYVETGKSGRAPRGREYRWQVLPYGLWTCADGSEVLFNRRYAPLWQRAETGARPVPADPAQRVPFVRQFWFPAAGMTEAERVAVGVAALAAWGLPTPPRGAGCRA